MVLEYSFWWIFPVLVLSLIVAYLKFRKISTLPDISSGVALSVSFLRFLVIFILLFLLLKPALSFVNHVKQKPLLIIAQDNSASLVKTKDSLYYRNEYKESLEKVIGKLKDKFDITRLTFGNDVRNNREMDFSESRTNISGVFDYIKQNYKYKNPDALILLSDGIYNTGINPRYRIPGFPVYTVELGDTVSLPDIYIKNIESNKFNFIHSIFPVKVEIGAVKRSGAQVKCVLLENGDPVSEKTIQVDDDHFFSELTFDIEAKKKGVARYTAILENVQDERNRENDKAETLVDIIDNSGDVSLFYSVPHPDIAAITNAINFSAIYKCIPHELNEPTDKLQSKLIIFHNPDPSASNYRKIADWAELHHCPVWYILTTYEHINNFARFGKDFATDFSNGINEYAGIAFNKQFPFFEFTEDEIAGFGEFPPLIVPFGEINDRAGESLFTQRVKKTDTPSGMLSFYNYGENKICYLWGEGLWRWRLYSYKENGNHELFNILIHKIINYLTAQKKAERFIHDIRPYYDETENVVINAELYDDSYEQINTSDVKLILNNGYTNFEYILNRNGNKYRIDLGNLPAGDYKYNLSVDLKGELFDTEGRFSVMVKNLEANDLVANNQMLRELAEYSGGKSFNLDGLSQLTDLMNEEAGFHPTYKSEVKFLELSEIKVLGIILILLLCIEWFLLKYYVG